MVSSTFELINESSAKQWHLERARIIFAIEEMTQGGEQILDDGQW